MATVWNGSLVVAGGYDSQSKTLGTVEKYDAIHKTWYLLSSMVKEAAEGYLI